MKTVLFMPLTLSECDHLIKLVSAHLQPPSGGFLLPTFKPLQAKAGRVLRVNQNQALKSAF
tara:strand:- start:648 stop:830 length:183 start_codon:yes stop_codon:yes gene_type:complete